MTSPTDNGPSDRLPRLHMLDGLRGFCAVSLMFYHLFAWKGMDQFQVGTFGVYLFYVLSGFSMWYVYASRPLTLSLLKSFFVARFARIFPLYFMVALLSIAARAYAEGSASLDMALLHRFLLNVTFLFGFNDPGKISIMPGGWSIGIEWVFYFLFPLFLLGVRNLRVMLALLAAGLLLNVVITSTLLPGAHFDSVWMSYTQFPTFIVYFVAGITAAEIFSRCRGRYALPGWLCRIVPMAALALIFAWPSPTVEAYLQGPHVVVLVAASMLALIFAGLLRNPNRAEIAVYSFLGEISYGTYLLFFFVYNAMQIALKHVNPAYGFGYLAVLSPPATILAAYMIYRFFEMPARRAINQKGNAR